MKAYNNESDPVRIAVLETISDQSSKTLIRLEDKIDKNFSIIHKELIEIKKENTNQFRIMIFTLLTLIGTPLLLESIKLLSKIVSA